MRRAVAFWAIDRCGASGAGLAGDGPGEFNQPTDVAVAPNGDIYVADGHVAGGTAVGSARIVRLQCERSFPTRARTRIRAGRAWPKA